MTRKTLRFYKNLTAEIISTADSNHYLVAVSDRNLADPKLITTEDKRFITFNGLAQAKHWVREQGFDKAYLRMETPYDEMVEHRCPPERLPLNLL